MIDFDPIQDAVYAALAATPATYTTYDAVPQGATYPYLVLGEITALPDEDLAEPTVDLTLTIHAWSKQHGKGQTFAMLEFVRDRLDGQAIGGGAWACSEDFTTVIEDRASTAASRLYHGVARYRIRA